MPDKFSIGVGNCRARVNDRCTTGKVQQICKPVIGFGEACCPPQRRDGGLAGEQRVVDGNLKGKMSRGRSRTGASQAQHERGRTLLITLNAINTRPQYRIQLTGEEQKRTESFASLKFALLLSIALIYMVLAAQFESLRHPFTILLTIPLAAVGAIVIFFVLGMPLNIMAYIGIIMLVGIAVNDSIILVDAINQLRRDGAALDEAILDAGQRRIRPIIMTSLTTILALLPLTFGYGDSASLRAPMALAVIGGLVTSTILTLVVIPCAYYVIDGLRLRRGEG